MKGNGQHQRFSSMSMDSNSKYRIDNDEHQSADHQEHTKLVDGGNFSSVGLNYRNDSGYISCGHVTSGLCSSELSVADSATMSSTSSINYSSVPPLRLASDYSSGDDEDFDSGLNVQMVERFGRLNVLETTTPTSPSTSFLSNPSSSCLVNEAAVQRHLGLIPSTDDTPSVNDDVHEESWRRLCEDAFRPDKDGDTYLHLAIVHGRWDIINRMVELSPNRSFLDFQNNLLQSPLHLAVLVDLPRTVRQLVLSDATLDVRNRVGNTPLHVACELGRVDCVRELLRPITVLESLSDDRRRHRAASALASQPFPQDLEMRNYEGQMCVHLASLGHHLEVLELLRNAGANINAREGKSGRTALCLAIEARRWTLVSFLVGECGASVNEPTYAGLTPFQLAYAADPQLATVLLRLGARPTQPVLSSDDTDDTDSDYGSIADEGMDVVHEEQASPTTTSKYFDLKINGEPLW